VVSRCAAWLKSIRSVATGVVARDFFFCRWWPAAARPTSKARSQLCGVPIENGRDTRKQRDFLRKARRKMTYRQPQSAKGVPSDYYSNEPMGRIDRARPLALTRIDGFDRSGRSGFAPWSRGTVAGNLIVVKFWWEFISVADAFHPRACALSVQPRKALWRRHAWASRISPDKIALRLFPIR